MDISLHVPGIAALVVAAVFWIACLGHLCAATVSSCEERRSRVPAGAKAWWELTVIHYALAAALTYFPLMSCGRAKSGLVAIALLTLSCCITWVSVVVRDGLDRACA